MSTFRKVDLNLSSKDTEDTDRAPIAETYGENYALITLQKVMFLLLLIIESFSSKTLI